MLDLTAAAMDPGTFGALVLGRPLWQHQLEFAKSKARYRVVCAGRQVGKSTGVSVIALYEATTRAGILVLLVSAGETASKRLLEECASLARGSELLSGSVVDASMSTLTLSNGSRILSVPASTRQIRGWPVDLLIIDEAGFVGQDVWQAAEPSIIARPGSRVILLSSPWGDSEHFFRALWNRGMDSPDEHVEAWHWPSTISPLVDKDLLEEIRRRETAEYFVREFLAEWTDAAGAYFSEAEIMGCVADYEMCAPEDLERWLDRPFAASAGVDWGNHADANALVLVGVLEDFGLNEAPDGRMVFFLPWLEVHYRMPYTDFIRRIVDVAGRYALETVTSELNGVGQYPTEHLRNALYTADRAAYVAQVTTTAKRKQSGFAMIKVLLQNKQLVLPRHPELLKQLRGLEFEQQASGTVRIAVPDRVGHDDLAMAFMQAISGIDPRFAFRQAASWGESPAPAFTGSESDLVATPRGYLVPVRARPVAFHTDSLRTARGRDTGDGW